VSSWVKGRSLRGSEASEKGQTAEERISQKRFRSSASSKSGKEKDWHVKRHIQVLTKKKDKAAA
jgi:hypothetical protein